MSSDGALVKVSCFYDQNIYKMLLTLWVEFLTVISSSVFLVKFLKSKNSTKWAEFWTKKQLTTEFFKNSSQKLSRIPTRILVSTFSGLRYLVTWNNIILFGVWTSAISWWQHCCFIWQNLHSRPSFSKWTKHFIRAKRFDNKNAS